MPAIDFDTERTYDSERFAAQEVFRTDRSNVVCGFFDPGQFIPVHAPGNDVVISVRDGTGASETGPASFARAIQTTESAPETWSSSRPTQPGESGLTTTVVSRRCS
jgi:hypothetical protein